MFSASLLLFIVVFGGLVFVLFSGRRKRNARGECTTGAPGSPESPVFGKPEGKALKSKM